MCAHRLLAVIRCLRVFLTSTWGGPLSAGAARYGNGFSLSLSSARSWAKPLMHIISLIAAPHPCPTSEVGMFYDLPFADGETEGLSA